MVKLICLDIDGTLLDPELNISRENREAIRLAQEHGIAVTLATGRMFASALIYARELKLDVPLVTMNGALIKHPFTQAKLHELRLGRRELGEVIAKITSAGYQPNFYDEFNLYAGSGLQRYYDNRILASLDPRYRIVEMGGEFSYQDLMDRYGDQVLKGIFFPSLEDKEPLRAALQEIGSIAVVSSAPTNLEITHHEADKGRGIRLLGDSMGISPEEIMVIGDSENDRTMLEAAGYSVAMGNASASIQAAAKFVTLDNTQHGVARAIRDIALGGL